MGFGPCRFGLGQILHPASDMNDVRFVESAVKHLTERRQRCSDKGGGWLGGRAGGKRGSKSGWPLMKCSVASANNTLH